MIQVAPNLEPITIAPDLTITPASPELLRLNEPEIQAFETWLADPETLCSSCAPAALAPLLGERGISVSLETLASQAVLAEYLTGNLQAVRSPQSAVHGQEDAVIQNPTSKIQNEFPAFEGPLHVSMATVQQLAQAYGLTLNAVELTPEELLVVHSPAIVALDLTQDRVPDHYVVLTHATDAMVTYLESDGLSEQIPTSFFLRLFTGFALVASAESVGRLLSQAQARAIRGGKRSYWGDYPDVSQLFEEPSTTDVALATGLTVLATVGVPLLGGAVGSGLGVGQSLANFGTGAFYSQLGQAVTNLSATQLGLGPSESQILGYAFTGALSGATSLTQSPAGSSWYDAKWLGSWWNDTPLLQGAVMGAVQGAAIGGGQVLAYELLNDTSFYQDNPFIGRQVASLLGGAGGYLGFNAFLDLAQIQGLQTVPERYYGKTPKELLAAGATEHTNQLGQPAGLGLSPNAYQRLWDGGIMPNLRNAFFNPTFLSSVVSQSLGLAIEYALPDLQYNRLLGQSLGGVGGAYLTGNTGWDVLGNAALSGLGSGLASLALRELGRDFDLVSGKNKNQWGLTPLQMAGVEDLMTSAARAGVAAIGYEVGLVPEAAGRFSGPLDLAKHVALEGLRDFATNYATWGQTAPFFTKGAAGWSEVQYLTKLAQFGGYADLAANADYLMRIRRQSWGGGRRLHGA